jgi:hypothetical protein
VMELKKLVRPPSVIELSSSPRMMKSISFMGRPRARCVLSDDSQIASSMLVHLQEEGHLPSHRT